MTFGPNVTGLNTLIYLGAPGYTSVAREWNCLRRTNIGAHDKRSSLEDYNSNFTWAASTTDKPVSSGATGYKPIVGDWNASRTTKSAPYLNGFWVIDINSTFIWDRPTEKVAFCGGNGKIPIVGQS